MWQGRIQGIKLPGAATEQTILQYANDTSLTLRGEEQVLLHTVTTLCTFNSGSGLMLNWKKSGAYFWAAGNPQLPDSTHQFGLQ
jgi:hypothetical protein